MYVFSSHHMLHWYCNKRTLIEYGACGWSQRTPPVGTRHNAYSKFWGDKERALWYVMLFSGVANKVVVVCQKAKTHAYLDTFILRDRSFIRAGGGGGANGVGSYLFLHLKIGSCIKLCNHFWGAMYFCAFQFLFHKKEIILKESRASQIEIYYQNDSITNQHNMVYSSPLTLEK